MAIIPCAVYYILVAYHFIHSSLYLLILYPCLTPTSFYPLVTNSLFSVSESLTNTM